MQRHLGVGLAVAAATLWLCGCGVFRPVYRFSSRAAASLPGEAAQLAANRAESRIHVPHGRAHDGTTGFADFLRGRIIERLAAAGYVVTESENAADFVLNYNWENAADDASYLTDRRRETGSIVTSDGRTHTIYENVTERVQRTAYRQTLDLRLLNHAGSVVWTGHAMNNGYRGANEHDAFTRLTRLALRRFCAGQ